MEIGTMIKQEFFELCSSSYLTQPDYPFDEDFETAVLRHTDNRKWYAIVMKVSRRKFGFDSDEVIDVVNLKLPTEMVTPQAPSLTQSDPSIGHQGIWNCISHIFSEHVKDGTSTTSPIRKACG